MAKMLLSKGCFPYLFFFFLSGTSWWTRTFDVCNIGGFCLTTWHPTVKTKKIGGANAAGMCSGVSWMDAFGSVGMHKAVLGVVFFFLYMIFLCMVYSGGYRSFHSIQGQESSILRHSGGRRITNFHFSFSKTFDCALLSCITVLMARSITNTYPNARSCSRLGVRPQRADVSRALGE